MIFHREQYLELMTFGDFPRPMFVELFGPMVGLQEEWRAQGATPAELDLTAFDWDYVPIVDCGGNTGVYPDRPTTLLEETEEYQIQRDPLGRTVKLYKQKATIPLPVDYPVHDMDSWLKIKPMFTFQEGRIDRDAVAYAREQQARGKLVVATIPGGFDLPRELMGEETACLCYYENPELMHDILHTLCDTVLRVLERISAHLVIDQVSVHEDLAGKSGPLIGPGQVKEFIQPYYRSVWELLSSRGTRLFDMDSDGDLTPILDLFLEYGVNSMHPFEPAAGMDIVKIRKRYGNRLAIRGGIDKYVLRQGKEAIRKELEYKIQPFMQQGGIAFGLDHRIPNGTPLENYRYYVDLGRQLLGLPSRTPQQTGWQRMAF